MGLVVALAVLSIVCVKVARLLRDVGRMADEEWRLNASQIDGDRQ